MTCAWLFALLALWGLPSALRPGGEGLVSWIAQTFLQLVLLSVILVGQNLQSQKQIEHHESHAEKLDEILTHHRGKS